MGLGDEDPLVIIWRFSRPAVTVTSSSALFPTTMSERVFTVSRHRQLPTKISDKPGLRSRPNMRASMGLRKSEPTKSVFIPACAMVMPKFAATKVFPSSGAVLVTAKALVFSSVSLNRTLVLSARKLSETMDLGRRWVIRPIACPKPFSVIFPPNLSFRSSRTWW